jgi:hypothetical protein
MDLNRLTTGDKVIGISGIALFIFSFFKWLGISQGSNSASKSAWGFTLTLLAVILGILLVGYVAAKAGGVELPKLGGLTWNQVVFIVAAVIFLFILIKIITGPSGWNGFDIPDNVSKDRKIGIFLGLIASIGILAGAFLNLKEAGEIPDSLGGKKGDSTPPPPAA